MYLNSTFYSNLEWSWSSCNQLRSLKPLCRFNTISLIRLGAQSCWHKLRAAKNKIDLHNLYMPTSRPPVNIAQAIGNITVSSSVSHY